MATDNIAGPGTWWEGARQWIRSSGIVPRRAPRIGLALGGGFARGIAHVGVLRSFERHRIPIHCIGGVSAGSMVAAAYASGATPDEIESVARTMRFSDVARWKFSKLGLAGSDPMVEFLRRLLKVFTFEEMKIALAVVASDLNAGVPAVFRDKGDVILPIRASCSYPGLFQPVRFMNHCLVDGMVTMDIPAAPLRRMGATHVISVNLPQPTEGIDPQNMLSVVTRCFQVMTGRMESQWRRYSSLVISPQVAEVGWNSFESVQQLVAAGEHAAEIAIPTIRKWFPAQAPATAGPVTQPVVAA